VAKRTLGNSATTRGNSSRSTSSNSSKYHSSRSVHLGAQLTQSSSSVVKAHVRDPIKAHARDPILITSSNQRPTQINSVSRLAVTRIELRGSVSRQHKHSSSSRRETLKPSKTRELPTSSRSSNKSRDQSSRRQ